MQGCQFCLPWGYFAYILMVYKVDSEIIRNKLQVLNVTLEDYVDTLLNSPETEILTSERLCIA